jgi:hypothetical protein
MQKNLQNRLEAGLKVLLLRLSVLEKRLFIVGEILLVLPNVPAQLEKGLLMLAHASDFCVGSFLVEIVHLIL